MIEEFLFKAGIPTYKTNLITQITSAKSINLGAQAPTNIGWIYGMSLLVGGTDYQGNTLISLADAGNLWLNLLIQTNNFTQNLRLSNLVYQQPNITRTQDKNYCPVSVPLELDWKQSTIANPTGIASGYVNLDMYYIDIPSYNNLKQSGMIWVNGQKLNA